MLSAKTLNSSIDMSAIPINRHCGCFFEKVSPLIKQLYHISPGQFLELGIVDVCPVQRDDVPIGIVGGAEHETVVGGSRGEANVRRHSLIGVDVGVNLNSAFFLSCLRMASHALEYEVGEERNGRGIYDLQPMEPFGNLPAAAVR